MNNKAPPLAISVIVVGRDGFASLYPILTCLTEQTIAQKMEVIAVMPKDENSEIPSEFFSAFGALKVVQTGKIGNRGKATSPGVMAATTPIIAFSENHCFPDPEWADILVSAYNGTIAGVAPSVLNANPESILSWTAYAGGYSIFAPEHEERELEEMPLHNTSYRRDLLAPLGNELDYLLADERRLQRRLRNRGAIFRFIPQARTRHLNEATWKLVLALNWINGRRFGGRRGKDWPISRRLFYAAIFPLLSISVLLESLKRLAPLKDRPALGPGLVFATWVASLAHTFGESLGYLSGPKDTFAFLDLEEFMILERLGGKPLRDPRIANFISKAAKLKTEIK